MHQLANALRTGSIQTGRVISLTRTRIDSSGLLKTGTANVAIVLLSFGPAPDVMVWNHCYHYWGDLSFILTAIDTMWSHTTT
jgi:hypothetical protein